MELIPNVFLFELHRLPGALPPDRRATPQPARGRLRAAPPLDCTVLSGSTLNTTPVSTESGESQNTLVTTSKALLI